MAVLRARSLPSLLALALVLGAAAGTLACEDQEDEIGTPCNSKEDCSEGLICDIHEGMGTCQYPHGHQSEAEEPEIALP